MEQSPSTLQIALCIDAYLTEGQRIFETLRQQAKEGNTSANQSLARVRGRRLD